MQEINDEEQQTVESLISPKAAARYQWYREHKRFAIAISIIAAAFVLFGVGGTAAMFIIGKNNQRETRTNYDQVDKINTLQNVSDGVMPLIDKYAVSVVSSEEQKVFQEIKNYLLDFGYFTIDDITFTTTNFNQAVTDYISWSNSARSDYIDTVGSFNKAIYNLQIPSRDAAVLEKFSKQLSSIDMNVYANRQLYYDACDFTYLAILPAVGGIVLFIGILYVSGIKQRQEYRKNAKQDI